MKNMKRFLLIAVCLCLIFMVGCNKNTEKSIENIEELTMEDDVIEEVVEPEVNEEDIVEETVKEENIVEEVIELKDNEVKINDDIVAFDDLQEYLESHDWTKETEVHQTVYYKDDMKIGLYSYATMFMTFSTDVDTKIQLSNNLYLGKTTLDEMKAAGFDLVPDEANKNGYLLDNNFYHFTEDNILDYVEIGR